MAESNRNVAPSRLPTFNDIPFTDIYKGKLTPEAYMFMSHAFSRLGQIVDQFIDGLRLPVKAFGDPSTDPTELYVLIDNDLYPIGTIWFNSDDGKIYVKTALKGTNPHAGYKIIQYEP